MREMKMVKKISAVLATAALLALPGAAGAPELLDRVIAIVEKDAILESEFKEQLEIVRRNLSARGTEPPPAQILERQVLSNMVLDSLQLQRGEQAGVQISDEELGRMMESMAEGRGLSLDALRQALEKEGGSYRQIRSQLRRQMIIEEVQRGSVRRRIQISKAEVDRFLASEEGLLLHEAEYRLLHLHLPLEADTPEASRAAAGVYMENLQKRLQEGASPPTSGEQTEAGYALRTLDLGWRTVSEVPTLVAGKVAGMAPRDTIGPIQNVSGLHLMQLLQKRGGREQLVPQTKVRHILMQPSIIRSAERTLQTLKDVRRQILAGNDFSDLAQVYSDDPGSRQAGGDLGWVIQGELEPDFEEVMNATPKGSLSEVFRGTNGWHILEVLERREKNLADEIIRRRAQNILFERKYKEELSAWLDEIRDEAYVEVRE